MNQIVIGDNVFQEKIGVKLQEIVQMMAEEIGVSLTNPNNHNAEVNQLNKQLTELKDEFNDFKTKNNRKLEIINSEIVNDFNHFEKRVNEAAEYIVAERENWDKAFERTNTLKGHRKDKKLMRYAHSKIYKKNGDKNTLVSSLFHGDMVAMVWSEIYDIFNVSSYGDIPITEESKAYRVVDSVVNGWDLEVIRGRILNNYRERKDNKSLPNSKLRYYDEYLLKIDGGLKVVRNKSSI